MTPFIKKKEIKKNWYIINAQNVAVGQNCLQTNTYDKFILIGENIC